MSLHAGKGTGWRIYPDLSWRGNWSSVATTARVNNVNVLQGRVQAGESIPSSAGEETGALSQLLPELTM
jgi:hypothetical protein